MKSTYLLFQLSVFLFLISCTNNQNVETTQKPVDTSVKSDKIVEKPVDSIVESPAPPPPGSNIWIDATPNDKYKMILKGKELGDSQFMTIYNIVNNITSDTALRIESVTKDMNSILIFWTDDEDVIIYENREKNPSTIDMFNLKEKKVICSVPGLINDEKSRKPMYYDRKNSMLFYFSNHHTDRFYHFHINKFDIKNMQASVLDSVSTWRDPFEGFPKIKQLNTVNRNIIVMYCKAMTEYDTLKLEY